jgi:CubicO group peptidase (beta-lactamase class C family)
MIGSKFIFGGTASMISRTLQAYLPPCFLEKDRLGKVQGLFPAIDAMYQEYAKKNHFPGYAYGILLDGKLIHSGSGGFSNFYKKIPVTSQSIFRVASMTKSFTAMAILKLRDEGKIHLDDPISLYLPEMHTQNLTQDAPAILIRDLLIHSAGLPTDDPWADRRLDATDEEFLVLLKKKLIFSNASGVGFEYSNLGYVLLGFVIKKVTGMPSGEYIRREIWDPLGMKDAAWEFTHIPDAKLVHGYKWIDEQWQEEEMLHDGVFGPMGGMFASIESFSRYMAHHQMAWPPRNEEEISPIKRSSIREMHRPWNFVKLATDFKYTEGRDCTMIYGYGYGLVWHRDSLGRIFVGHNGGLPGFGSNWYIMPEYGLGIVLFANATYAPAFKINLSVLDKLIVESHLQPRQLPPSQILKKRRDELIKLLPQWEHAAASGIFAGNFFLDRSLDLLQKQSRSLFSKTGKILSISDVIPENQLSGSFLLRGEKRTLRVHFGLTAENPSLIQKYELIEMEQA